MVSSPSRTSPGREAPPVATHLFAGWGAFCTHGPHTTQEVARVTVSEPLPHTVPSSTEGQERASGEEAPRVFLERSSDLHLTLKSNLLLSLSPALAPLTHFCGRGDLWPGASSLLSEEGTRFCSPFRGSLPPARRAGRAISVPWPEALAPQREPRWAALVDL